MAESITLQTSDNNVQQSDVLGRLSFAASNESSASDARLIAASIYAVAETDFTEISNATSLILATASSESASEVMRITSVGDVGVGTSSPSSKLEIVGDGGTSDSGILTISDPNGGATTSWIKLYADDGFDDLTWHISYSDTTIFKALEFRTAFNNLPEVTIEPSGEFWILSDKSVYTYRYLSDAVRFNTSSQPAYSWSMDEDTGMFRPTANVVAFSTAGNERIRIDSNGNVGIGTPLPSSSLDVSGVITATSGNSTNWNAAHGWGNHALQGYLTNISAQNIQDLNNVISDLSYPLLVDEYTLIYDSGISQFKGSTINLGLIRQGSIPLTGYSTSYLGYYIRMNNGEFTVNEQGANLDFRVEGDTDTNLLFADASTDRVGIGTSSPSSKLHVNGPITVAAGSAAAPALTFADDSDIGIYRAGVNSLAFSTSGVERIRIGPDGEVGIGITGASTIGLRILHDANANNIVGSVLNVQMPASALTSYGYWTAPSLLAESTAYTTHIHYIANPISSIPSGSSAGTEVGFQFGNSIQQHTVRGFTSFLNTLAGYERYAFLAGGTAPSLFNGVVWFANGSNSAPSIAFSSDTDTGFFYPTANNLAITTGGTERLRIDSSGKILVGTTTSRTAGPAVHPAFQFEGTNAGSASFQCIAGSAQAAVCPQILLARHRGVVGASNIVASGDSIGLIRFNGGDDTDCVSTAAQIECIIDGTPGSNDMPGSLIFSTTSDGSAVSTERMRITSAGNVGVGTNSPTERLDINSDAIRIRTAQTPASATAAGNTGDICWDSNYLYVCVATNTWKRSALSTWP